jgi:hypothetical protein
MFDIVYYLAGVSIFGSVSYCILYIYDRDSVDYIAQKSSWNAVKAYHKINLEIDNLKRWYYANENKDEDEEIVELDEITETVEFIGYKESDDTTYTSTSLENNKYIQDTDFDLMFLKKKENDVELYKNIKMEKVDKQFIQIELCQNSNKTSIHKNLEGFYLTDNTLLDYVFLKWYVNKFYGLLLADTYKLSIIDSDINMFNLDKNQSIIINSKKNYDINTSIK